MVCLLVFFCGGGQNYPPIPIEKQKKKAPPPPFWNPGSATAINIFILNEWFIREQKLNIIYKIKFNSYVVWL